MIYGIVKDVKVFVMPKNTAKLKAGYIAIQSIATGETGIVKKTEFKQVNNITGWFK